MSDEKDLTWDIAQDPRSEQWLSPWRAYAQSLQDGYSKPFYADRAQGIRLGIRKGKTIKDGGTGRPHYHILSSKGGRGTGAIKSWAHIFLEDEYQRRCRALSFVEREGNIRQKDLFYLTFTDLVIEDPLDRYWPDLSGHVGECYPQICGGGRLHLEVKVTHYVDAIKGLVLLLLEEPVLELDFPKDVAKYKFRESDSEEKRLQLEEKLRLYIREGPPSRWIVPPIRSARSISFGYEREIHDHRRGYFSRLRAGLRGVADYCKGPIQVRHRELDPLLEECEEISDKEFTYRLSDTFRRLLKLRLQMRTGITQEHANQFYEQLGKLFLEASKTVALLRAGKL